MLRMRPLNASGAFSCTSELSVENAVVMTSFVERATAPWRFSAWTLGLLGVIALALASFGVFATLSQSVVERTREIGIRVALGATPSAVLRETMEGGLRTAAVGVVAGTAAAAGLSRIFISRVPGLQQADVTTLALTAGGMLILAACTILLPARRAARVDPVDALRIEG